ncbi:MAG TPA: vWA domain-containing protein [Pseudomonadales bacterium]
MFELLFKYPAAVFERGELVFAPSFRGFEALVVVMVLVLAVALVVLFGMPRRPVTLGPGRRAGLAALQALFAAAVLLLLAQPTLELATLAPGANAVAVLVDNSESMSFDAGSGDGSRLDVARAAVSGTLEPSLAPVGEVVTFAFGATARRAELDALKADEPRTRLVGAIEDVIASFRGRPLAALVVLSDGADNGTEHDLAALAAAGVPVHTVGIGPATLPGEVQLSGVSLPSEAPPQTRVVAELELRHSSAGPVIVKVLDGARLVAAEEAELDPERPVQRLAVPFDSGPGGIRELRFVVEPPAGDHLAGNNRQERLLTVSEQQRRVLYLEGEPRWEYKFIRRAVAGDRVLELTSWLRTTERKTYRQDVRDPDELRAGFPEDRAGLYGYDVIVLGSLAATYLSDEQHDWLERFVGERGGSLLALAGREALADGGWDVTPLARALPVRLARSATSGYRAVEAEVRLTAAGAHSPMMQLVDVEGGDAWASLPPLGDHQPLGALKPAATTLLEVLIDGEPRPLLVTQPYGLGTTAVLATATTWRWQMRTPPHDVRHTLFWRQLLRQLAEAARQQREVRLTATDDGIEVALIERDELFEPRRVARAHALVFGPAGVEQRLELTSEGVSGVLRGRHPVSDPGVYRVDVHPPGDPEPVTRFVRIGGERAEHFEPARNDALLERIAESTGGRYWRPEEIGDIARALTFDAAGLKRIERFPLWDMPAALLLLVALKGGEWLLRRRWGRI